MTFFRWRFNLDERDINVRCAHCDIVFGKSPSLPTTVVEVARVTRKSSSNRVDEGVENEDLAAVREGQPPEEWRGVLKQLSSLTRGEYPGAARG